MGISEQTRVGRVVSVNAERMTCRVTYPDRDGQVSGELALLTRGTSGTKDYWCPAIGDDVAVLLLGNSKNYSAGWVLGCFFNDRTPPNAADAQTRRIDFADGTVIEYDGASSSLNITCAGTINITGGGDVVVGGVSLVNHTHGGVTPGGGSTAPPNK